MGVAPRTSRERVLLLVDVSYQCYRAAAAHPLLEDADGRFTGGLYGFFQTLGKMVRETGATRLVACVDRKPYLRSLAYPGYKQLRRGRDTEAKQDLLARYEATVPLVLGTLRALGVEPWGLPGFEADDMAAHAVLRHRHRFDRVYAGSNDSDLFQLFGAAPNFSVYAKDIEGCWNAERLMSSYGMTAEEYMLSTALMGTHNDLDGIPGVGEVTSRKAAKDPALLRKYRASHGELIDRNLSLIRLPHPDFPGAALPEQGEAGPRDVYRALGRYDIQATASMVEAVLQTQRRT